MHRIVAAAALLAIAAPAASQTYLDKLLAKIAGPKPAAQPGQAGSFTAAMTPEQTTALDRLLAQPLIDKRIAADRMEAAALIRTLVTTGACATSAEAWNAVNRFHMSPSTYTGANWLLPMFGLKYHDKSRCLDVQRLTDWSKPANNALKLVVYYLAADSGEASHQGFELQKASDGQWMIRNIGNVSN